MLCFTNHPGYTSKIQVNRIPKVYFKKARKLEQHKRKLFLLIIFTKLLVKNAKFIQKVVNLAVIESKMQ